MNNIKEFSEALRRGLAESVELEEDGALELRKMEENVNSNISAIGELLKVELSKSKPLSPVTVEEVVFIKEPKIVKETVSEISVKGKLLELGNILHSALTNAKNKSPLVSEVSNHIETELVIEPTEPVEEFDEDKANENINNSFANIANLLKKELRPDAVREVEPVKTVAPQSTIEPEVPEKEAITNDVINNYVDMLDKISKESPVENKEDNQTESEMSPAMLKYINEQVTALRVQIGHAMESGGGTVAQQFANGGTMNGNLTVTGTISASNYAGIPLQDLSGYLPLSGGTLTGNVSSTSSLFITGSGIFSDLTVLNSISANTINATLLNVASANITIIDIKQYELSGFNVTGNVSVVGSVSSTAVVYASGGNSNQWNSSFTTISTNSANWSNSLPLSGGTITNDLTIQGSVSCLNYMYAASGFQLYDAGLAKIVTITCYNGILTVN